MIELNNIKYILQGIAQIYHFSNINIILEIQLYDGGNVKFIPHSVPLDGLSEVYDSNIVNFIEQPQLGFFQKIYRLFIKSYLYIFSN